MLVPFHYRSYPKGATAQEIIPNTKAEQVRGKGESPSLSSFAASHGVLERAKGSVVFQRYCHVYRHGELEHLIGLLEPRVVRIVDSYYDTGNWCVVIEKL